MGGERAVDSTYIVHVLTHVHHHHPNQVTDERLKDLLADEAQAAHEREQVQGLLQAIRLEAAAVMAADRCGLGGCGCVLWGVVGGFDGWCMRL